MIISQAQSAFVAEWQIEDNILIAHEVFHFLELRKAKKSFEMGIKLDMNKAYDRVVMLKTTKSYLTSSLPMTLCFSSWLLNSIARTWCGCCMHTALLLDSPSISNPTFILVKMCWLFLNITSKIPLGWMQLHILASTSAFLPYREEPKRKLLLTSMRESRRRLGAGSIICYLKWAGRS